jgi:hypothetical protein
MAYWNCGTPGAEHQPASHHGATCPAVRPLGGTFIILIVIVVTAGFQLLALVCINDNWSQQSEIETFRLTGFFFAFASSSSEMTITAGG